MKIARILRDVPDEDAQLPALALERDGAIYDVAELDRSFGTRLSTEAIEGAFDFHGRVVALACAGLEDLDRRLRAGDRPTEARVLPGTFQWLPPCDTERALYVQMAPYDDLAPEPIYRLGHARGLLGHDESVPFPHLAIAAGVELGFAAILGDDVRDATPEEAERAILGYAVLADWTPRSSEPFTARPARDLAVQLGPTLVTRDEAGEVERLRAQVRVDGKIALSGSTGGAPFSIAESIAFVSHRIALRAGDVIGAGSIAGCRASASGLEVPFGAPVELAIERLGKLSARPMRGPEPPRYRR